MKKKKIVMLSIMIILTISIFLLNSKGQESYINRDELLGVMHKPKGSSSYVEWTGNTFPGRKTNYELDKTKTSCYDVNGNLVSDSSANYIMTYKPNAGEIQLTINKAINCNLYFTGQDTSSSGGGSEHCDGRKLVNSDGDWVGYCSCFDDSNYSSTCDASLDDGTCDNSVLVYNCPGKWSHGTGKCYETTGFTVSGANDRCSELLDDCTYGLVECEGDRYFTTREQNCINNGIDPDNC